MKKYFRELADELGCSVVAAMDVWYLRQRSRWTEKLEKKLLKLHAEGNPPNMNEFGHE